MNSPAIPPETIAAKQAALKNFSAPAFAASVAANPRLIELLWFIQAYSSQPGGLPRLVESVIDQFPERLGTVAMRQIGEKPYTASERQQVIRSFPGWVDDYLLYSQQPSRGQQTACDLIDTFNMEMRGHESGIIQREPPRPNLAFINQKEFPYFLTYCRQLALAELPWKLEHFCSSPDACFYQPSYFQELTAALLEFMDVHAGRLSQTLATTKVAQVVFDTIEFAISERAMVEVIGGSRFGKTEAARHFCQMHPGRARRVRTPCDNSDRSLLEAIAEAVGIQISLRMTYRELKSKLDYVLRHCGLCFVFDEAAWLCPQRYGPRTPAMRWNYIRSNLLDSGSPVALITTPQFFATARHSFLKDTGFNAAQFRGRIMRSITLPDSLSEEDMFSVVDIHLPELPSAFKRMIVGCAMLDESYLFAVEKITKNVRAVARQRGHTQIDLTDLQQGISLAGFTLPDSGKPAPPGPAPVPRPAKPNKRPSSRAVRPAELTAPTRSTMPALSVEI